MKRTPGKITRTALRYFGGKWFLAGWIAAHFPAHRIYCEPFCGACSVLLRKPRSYSEAINDLDGEIVNFFRVLRDPAQARELERLVTLTPFARTEFESAYLPASDPIEGARRTLIKSLMGYGSDGITGDYTTGFRNDAHRSGTTPARDWANYPSAIVEFTARLQGVVIENRPYPYMLATFDRQDCLFYVDPPYLHSTRGRAAEHRYRFEMTEEDHCELACQLHQVQGMVVLSGYPSALYDELYSTWKCVTRKARADGASERTECLWLSPSVVEKLPARLDLDEAAD